MVIIKWILLIVVLIKYSHGNPMDSQETDFPMLDIPLEIPIPRPLTTKCGISNQNGVGTEIKKNKDQAAFGEFPWMVAVLKKRSFLGSYAASVHHCGGSLIHPSVVLTTAHSVTGDNVGTLIARAGEWDTQSIREPFPSVESNVACIVVHEQFQRRTGTYNIALLFLETPINNAEHINTVCLPPPHLSFDGQNCFVSGWGKDKFGQEGKYQPILKKIDMSVLDNQKCTAMFRNTRLGKYFTLNESLICAGGEEGKDACEGDGGSPLVCPVPGKKGRFYQAGIVAWGVQCGTANVPGAYTNVAFFADWIQEKIEDNKQIENNIKKIYGNERLQKDKFW